MIPCPALTASPPSMSHALNVPRRSHITRNPLPGGLYRARRVIAVLIHRFLDDFACRGRSLVVGVRGNKRGLVEDTFKFVLIETTSLVKHLVSKNNAA